MNDEQEVLATSLLAGIILRLHACGCYMGEIAQWALEFANNNIMFMRPAYMSTTWHSTLRPFLDKEGNNELALAIAQMMAFYITTNPNDKTFTEHAQWAGVVIRRNRNRKETAIEQVIKVRNEMEQQKNVKDPG